MKLIGEKKIGKPFPKGERHPGSKLSKVDIITIRIQHQKGALLRELADLYDVSIATVWKIIHRKTWEHIN